MWINDSVPFIAVVVRANISWDEIARRCYGEQEVINEHPVLYTINENPNAWSKLMDIFPTYPTTAFMGLRIIEDISSEKY